MILKFFAYLPNFAVDIPYIYIYYVYQFSILGSLAIQTIYFNTYNDPTFFTGLNCNGSEDHLFNCAINTSAPVCSSTGNDANVICPG